MFRLLLLAALAGVVSAVQLPVPAFLWSGKPLLHGSNTYAVEDVAAEGLGVFLTGFVSGDAAGAPGVLAALRGEEVRPAAAVVGFFYSHLEAGAAAPTSEFLRESMGSAASSAVVPYVYSADGAAPVWTALAGVEGALLLLGDHDEAARQPPPAGAKLVTAANLDQSLAAAEGPVVLLVELGSPSASSQSDKLMRAVSRAVGAATGEDYVAFLTALAPSSVPRGAVRASVVEMKNAYHRMLAEDASIGASNTTLPVRSNPSSLAGLVVSFVLFITVLIYFMCIADVQIPSKFVKRYPAKGKVFED